MKNIFSNTRQRLRYPNFRILGIPEISEDEQEKNTKVSWTVECAELLKFLVKQKVAEKELNSFQRRINSLKIMLLGDDILSQSAMIARVWRLEGNEKILVQNIDYGPFHPVVLTSTGTDKINAEMTLENLK